MTKSSDTEKYFTFSREEEGNKVDARFIPAPSISCTTGTLRIRSLAEPLLIHGEGVKSVKVPINMEREARRRQNLMCNNWLDDPDTSMRG